jgi:hypothetical protein
MNSTLEAILVVLGCFLAGATTDLVWAKYTLAVNRHDSIRAAIWSGGIFCAGAVGITAYIHNMWLLAPVALGGMAATYATVRYEKNRIEK